LAVQRDIIFSSTFDRMNIGRNLLQPADIPLIGFGGKRLNALGKISLPVSFGDMVNPRTEYITFDVVEMNYPYLAIFGWGLINKFKAVVHQLLSLHEDACGQGNYHYPQQSAAGPRYWAGRCPWSKECTYARS